MSDNLVKIVTNQGTERECCYMLSQEKYTEQVAMAEELLGSEFEGYLSLIECIEAQGILDKNNYFRFTNPELTKKRINKIKAAGIPPLFDPGIENPLESSTYPILDVLLQLPSGKLFERFRGQQAANKNPRIYASSMEDIIAFRTKAYDGDCLSPQVIRDTLDYLGRKKNECTITETILKTDEIMLKYLEASLKDVKPQERSYVSFDQSQPIDFIGNRFWHVEYTPKDRDNIAREYKKRIENGEQKLNTEHLKRMKVLFPDIVNIDYSKIEFARNISDMEEHIRQGDYRSMPPVVLVDYRYGTKYINVLRDHVITECERVTVEEPTEIFQPIMDLHQEFKIPMGLLYLEQFRDIITAKRIEVLQGMDDQSFAEYFNLHSRRASIGHRQHTSENLIDRQFRSLLLDRYTQLREQRRNAGLVHSAYLI